MQYKWINKNNSSSLIVFFNGWGMDEKIVQNLDCGSFDIIAFFDYRSFSLPKIDFSCYKKKYLISWSMGVYVCNLFYEELKDFDGYTAINGTQKPVDDNFGIPVNAYNLTIDNFNELTCKKFMKKISVPSNLQNYCPRSLDELKDELISLRDLKIDNFISFNKAILSEKDRIFPFDNMLKFWQETNAQIIRTDAGHYLFNKYTNWSDLI